MTPCPICKREPKWHKIGSSWVLSCVGARHTLAITEEGQHQVALYKSKTQEEISRAWDKAFAPGGAT